MFVSPATLIVPSVWGFVGVRVLDCVLYGCSARSASGLAWKVSNRITEAQICLNS